MDTITIIIAVILAILVITVFAYSIHQNKDEKKTARAFHTRILQSFWRRV